MSKDSPSLLFRSLAVVERPAPSSEDAHAGRRVDLVAIRYGLEHATKVSDGPRAMNPVTGRRGGTYSEAWAPGAFNRTFVQRPGSRPARDTHGTLIGGAEFRDTQAALLGTVTISRTTEGDATLERVLTHALDSASVGFRPIRHRLVQTASGPVVLRTEVDLREISLAPSDKVQHAGAEVLAVRSASTTPRLDAHRAAVAAHQREYAATLRKYARIFE